MVQKEAKYIHHHDLQNEKILQETKKLCLLHGIQQVNMIDIAKACGMTRATIYRYFASKEDILWAIMYLHLTKFNTEIKKNLQEAHTTYERFVRLSKVFIHQYESNEEFYLYNEIFQAQYLKASSNANFRWKHKYNTDKIKPGDLVHSLMENFHDGSMKTSLDPKLTCVSFVYSCNYMIHCAYDNQNALPIKYEIDSLDFIQHAMEVQLSYLRPS